MSLADEIARRWRGLWGDTADERGGFGAVQVYETGPEDRVALRRGAVKWKAPKDYLDADWAWVRKQVAPHELRYRVKAWAADGAYTTAFDQEFDGADARSLKAAKGYARELVASGVSSMAIVYAEAYFRRADRNETGPTWHVIQTLATYDTVPP